jgi:hypothetical protein
VRRAAVRVRGGRPCAALAGAAWLAHAAPGGVDLRCDRTLDAAPAALWGDPAAAHALRRLRFATGDGPPSDADSDAGEPFARCRRRFRRNSPPPRRS